MLNDLIRKTNTLAYRAKNSSDPAVRAEYERSLAETLKFVTDNNVPRDTVVIIEDRIVRELVRKEDESRLRADAETARAELEKARKEADWLARSVNAGMGAAQSRYIEIKNRMDDFRAESARSSGIEKSAMVDAFADLDREYREAKKEYERVGNSDRAVLLEKYREAQRRLSYAEAEYSRRAALAEGGRLDAPLTEVPSGSGAVAKALDGRVDEEIVSAVPAEEPVPTVPVFSSVSSAQPAPAVSVPAQPSAEDDVIYSGIALPDNRNVTVGTRVTDDDEVNRRISETINAALSDNERFRYILEEVRFQASLEVSKIRAEVEKIRNEAFKEAQRLMDELQQLKSDAAYLRMEANRARLAASTVDRAKASATLNAKRAMNAAKRTVAAARKAIDAAKTSQYRYDDPYGWH